MYTHIMVGALAGAIAPNVVLSPVFGVGSHIALDVLPHYDFEKVSHELILAGFALMILAAMGLLEVKTALGALFGALPDLENLLWKWGILPDEKKIFPSHNGLVPHGREIGRRDLLLQVTLSGLSMLIMIKI